MLLLLITITDALNLRYSSFAAMGKRGAPRANAEPAKADDYPQAKAQGKGRGKGKGKQQQLSFPASSMPSEKAKAGSSVYQDQAVPASKRKEYKNELARARADTTLPASDAASLDQSLKLSEQRAASDVVMAQMKKASVFEVGDAKQPPSQEFTAATGEQDVAAGQKLAETKGSEQHIVGAGAGAATLAAEQTDGHAAAPVLVEKEGGQPSG